jgi:predicted DNA-binding protein
MKAKQDRIQTAIRIPGSTLTRADKLAERMTKPDWRCTRADVLRLAMVEGLAALENAERKEPRR